MSLTPVSVFMGGLIWVYIRLWLKSCRSGDRCTEYLLLRRTEKAVAGWGINIIVFVSETKRAQPKAVKDGGGDAVEGEGNRGRGPVRL